MRYARWDTHQNHIIPQSSRNQRRSTWEATIRERWIGGSLKSLFPRRSTNCPALYASCGRACERRWPATSGRGFPTFTMPSLAPLPPPAASPRFIVHLSCFTLLEQQSPLTRQITGWKNEESRSFDRPRRHFLKSVRGGARRSWRNRRFIYLSAAWKKPWVPHEVLYLSCKP